MFAKSAVFFFALIAFVNAAPIVDYTTNPGVRPLHPIKSSPSDGIDYTTDPGVDVRPLHPDGGDEIHPRRGLSLDIAANPGVDVRPLQPIRFPLPVALKRDLSLGVGAGAGVDVRPWHPISLPEIHAVTSKRDLSSAVHADILGLNADFGVGISKRDNSAGLNFDFNPDFNLNLPSVGLDVNVNHPRDVNIGPVLSQLQSITTTLANLLHARDISGDVNAVGSQLNGLQTEGMDNTNDLQTEAVGEANNLLNSLNGILSSVH